MSALSLCVVLVAALWQQAVTGTSSEMERQNSDDAWFREFMNRTPLRSTPGIDVRAFGPLNAFQQPRVPDRSRSVSKRSQSDLSMDSASVQCYQQLLYSPYVGQIVRAEPTTTPSGERMYEAELPENLITSTYMLYIPTPVGYHRGQFNTFTTLKNENGDARLAAISYNTSTTITGPNGACVQADVTSVVIEGVARSGGSLPEAVLIRTQFCTDESCRYTISHGTPMLVAYKPIRMEEEQMADAYNARHSTVYM